MATAYMYGKTLANALGGETAGETSKIDYLSDTIKICLLTNSYTPNQDTDETYSNVSSYEVANGNGYTTGGATLASKTLVYTAGTNITVLSSAAVTWSSSTITARYAAIYDDTDATKPLICYIDFGADKSSSNNSFVINPDATYGWVKATVT